MEHQVSTSDEGKADLWSGSPAGGRGTSTAQTDSRP